MLVSTLRKVGSSLLLALIACAPSNDDADAVRRFGKVYIGKSGERVFGMRYLGVPLWQTPADAWVIQEIVMAHRPDFVIEVGTAHGGLALFLASTLEAAGVPGRVLAVDLKPQVAAAERFAAFRRRVEVFRSHSLDPALLRLLARRTANRRTFVLLDSDHSSTHVGRELRAYAPLVSRGGFLIVCDTILDSEPAWVERWARHHDRLAPGGPGLAVRDFLAASPDFQREPVEDRYLFSLHPGGFLRRRQP